MDIENNVKAGSLYKGIFELSPDSIVTLDTKGFITSINSAGAKILGYSVDELTGKHFAKIGYMNIRDIPKYIEIFTAVISGKDVKPLEINLNRKDGTPIVIEVRVGLLKENGKIIGIQAITRDITERKKAEEALRAAETRIRGLMNAVPVGISLSTTDGHLVEANDELWKMFGYGSREEYLKVPAIEHYYDTKDREILGEFRKKGPVFDHEIRFKRKDGAVIWGSVNSIEEKSPDGKIYFVSSMLDITKRKEAETKLKDSEERLSIIFNSAPDAYYLNDLKGTFLDGNKAAEKLTGYKKDDLLGKNFLKLNLLSLAQIPKAAALLAKNMMGLSTGPDEFNLNKKDGTQVLVEISTHPVKIKGQTMVLALARDLSECKKAEKGLKESEEKLKAIFDNANDGFLLASMKDKKFILANKAICKMTGYTPEEIKTLGVVDIHPKKDLPFVIDQFEKQARKEIEVAKDLPVKRKDGSIFYADVNASPVTLLGEACLLGVFRDVTERNKAGEALRESEERFRLAINATKEGIWEWDIQNNKEFFSPRWCEIIGYSFDDPELPHTYQSWASRIHPDDYDRVISAMNNHLEKGTKYDVDYRHRYRSGEYRWQNSIGQAVRDESGKPTKMVGCILDITERKAAEAMKEELLHKVEEANRNKTEYVSGVSHELRTPLASIKGFVSTIRSDKEMDEATRADFLRIIEEETDRLTRIIEDLLDISRIESGRLKLSMRSFNIMDLIMKNIENIKPLAESKGIDIQSHPAPAPYIVYADQDKTTQIMVNLLSNAIKYNKAGGKVRVAASEDDGKVRVDIEDTGIGISEKDLPHMFEKFFRAEGSSSETPGTGLGLAVTKSLVQVMGGMIEMQSKLGEGSRFSFSLPKYAGDQKEKTNDFS